MRIILLFLLLTICNRGYSQRVAAGDPLFSGDSLQPIISATLPEAAEVPYAKYLSLHLIFNGDTAETAVAVNYDLHGRQLAMQPLYPLAKGQKFLVRYRSGTSINYLVYNTPADKGRGEVPHVTRVYPFIDTLPTNLLFFYIQFSTPMQADEHAWKRLSIYQNDDSVAKSFAWRQRSFWLDSNKTLVLMVHPGRVKNGIDYGGALLSQGNRYTLVMEAGLLSELGVKIVSKDTLKQFIAGGADTVLPRLSSYNKHPHAGTNEAIQLRFSEPMGYATTMEGIQLISDNVQSMEIIMSQDTADARVFYLTPVVPWQAGAYQISLDYRVTDLAANTLKRHFEMKYQDEKDLDLQPIVLSIRAVEL